MITGAPRGAVFVDGRIITRGVSQVSVMLDPGSHRIRAQAPNYMPMVKVIDVKPGKAQTVTLNLDGKR